MSQPVLLKVYGNLAPVRPCMAAKVLAAAESCLPEPDYLPVVLENNLLRISFEGIYFPVEDVLDVLNSFLTVEQQGKLDVLDVENWQMTRYLIQNGVIAHSVAPLNNVLAYSGH